MRRSAFCTAFICAALFFAASSTRAQDAAPPPSAASTPAPDSSASTPTPAPAKRVWTNDDVGDLRGHSTISTVGPANTKQPKPTTKQPVANAETIRSYRDRILNLQKQIPDLDSKIAELQATLNGNTVNSTRHVGGTVIDDWHVQLAKAQQQREELNAKIGALQDQARHAGVPENQIPE
jgi:hypothetical protein